MVIITDCGKYYNQTGVKLMIIIRESGGAYND
jgi:hypothetical protein